MKINEYIWVMCDAIREDGDVSLFFVAYSAPAVS